MLSDRIATLILNPVAGKARGKQILFDVENALQQAGYSNRLHITTCRGEATLAAAKYASDSEVIACLGGDGTLNETISGVLTAENLEKKPKLCYIPAGTTNDFAATVGIPKDIPSILRSLKEDRTAEVDIGSFGNRFFTYIASFGIFTRASYSADQNTKNVLGHLAYVLEGAKEISDLGKVYHVSVEYDGGAVEGDYIFGSVSNTTSIGGIFKLPSDHVALGDGKFELMLIRAPQNLVEIQKDLDMMRTGDFDGEQIVFAQTSYARIRSTEPLAWCNDGEFAGDLTDVTVKNLHRAVEIFVK
ncbi:MAG: YegS/Rv2252/BmrU family lipid kinase [Lachnospiraceae bacterium]|nr:YegS/Rv2252/BmrU family lipid kinase [Lachnospiraceae bacterium]